MSEMNDVMTVRKSAADRIREAGERRAAKVDAEVKAREEQLAADVEAIEALEEKLGIRIHASKQVRQFVVGLPVVVGVRAPDAAEYKRMFSGVNRSNGNGDAKVAAHTMLANACWVYPQDAATRDAMLAANGGLLASVGNFANKLAEVELEEEGKE
jgi:hypothetical protein